MTMKLDDGAFLPFNFLLLMTDQGQYELEIINGKEIIKLKDVRLENDSLIARFPVFESELLLKIIDSNTVSGVWANHYKSDDYKLEVKANFGKSFRFQKKAFQNKIARKYQVTFSPNTENEYKSIGLFKQEEGKVTGTFATETGDYRHLEGVVSDDSLYLSTFDGSHAFLFKAAIEDSTLNGTFWSGSHFKEPWVAKIDSTFSLRNADSLTFLKKGYKSFDFSFPNSINELISLSDSQFDNKAVIIQIMGSWCPNCLDEIKYLNSLYEKYNKEGLEVVAIAFERTKTKEKAIQNLERLKLQTGANYTFLLGGATRNDRAEEKLPMLNHIMSYPTAIFLDKKKNIIKIHTGFYGPSTGKYYDDFTKETEELVQSMLAK